MKDLVERFQKFGLNTIESKVFLHLQGKPALTVVEISRKLRIPRSSIYDNCQKLIEKGLLEKVVKYRSQKFKAVHISKLELYLEDERKKLIQLEDDFAFLKANVSDQLEDQIETEVKYYHGAQGLRQIVWNSLQAEKEVVGYSIFGRVEIVGEEFTRRYTAEFKKKNLIDRVLINDQDEVVKRVRRYATIKDHHLHKKHPDRIRFLKKSQLHISSDIMIYNSTYAFSIWRSGEVVGVEIINPEFVKTEKSIFETLWKVAQPYSKFVIKQ